MNSGLSAIFRSRSILSLVGVLSIATLSGCMQSEAVENHFTAAFSPIKTNSDYISDSTLKVVNSAFHQVFMGGEWRYKGATNKNGSINAYIQIPQELDMSIKAQKNYLKQAICPSAQYKKMWDEIQGISLAVHLYTHTQKRSVFTTCDNPLA